MEGIIYQIEKLHQMSLICLIGTILFFVISIVLFRKLEIREVLKFLKRHWKKKSYVIIFCVMAILLWTIPAEASPEELKLTYLAVSKDDEGIVRIETGICEKPEEFMSEEVCLEYCVEGTDLWIPISSENQEWTNSAENMFETVWKFEGEEGEKNYSFRISYKEETLLSEQTMLIDKISPRFHAMYASESGEILKSGEDGKYLEPYYNAAREINLELCITEPNLDYEKTIVKVSMLDRNGNLLKEVAKYQLEEGEKIMQLKFASDAHYLVEAKMIDLAGNESVHKKAFALDYSPPEIADVSFLMGSGAKLTKWENQHTYQHFSKEKTYVYIKVKDCISGVKKIAYSYEDVEKKQLVTEIMDAKESDTDKNVAEIIVELPFSFKGSVQAYGIDHLENVAEEFVKNGVIAESKETHEETSRAWVEVKTHFSKTPDYYAQDVLLEFSVQDAYSGIEHISYTVGNQQEEVSYKEETEIMASEVLKEYTISASENQENQVPVGLTFSDNAGHQNVLSEEMLPRINIDTVSPEVWVEYDNVDVQNEKYYREERTATVYVAERNFDPEDVHFELSESEPQISGWSHHAGNGCEGGEDPGSTAHTDACVWTCQVNFFEEGEYSFGFFCVDFAGNEGRYEQTDEFVIDKTNPIVTVSYNNQNVKNGLYYQAPRTARILIEERNFDSSKVEIVMTAKNEDAKIAIPEVSSWTSVGEQHIAEIFYNYDGEFTFDITCEDLAGNLSQDYPEEHFIVDLTLPEIQIREVEDFSANRGVVSPLIQISDTHHDVSGTEILLTG